MGTGLSRKKQYPAFVPLVISILILFLAAPVFAAPHIRIHQKHYSIRGFTADELRQQMNKHGLKSDKGKTYDALTVWHVNWRMAFTSKGNHCVVRTVQTSVHVTFTFPKWRDESKATRELRNHWHTYLNALKAHEDGHRDIGVAAAGEIEKAIAAMNPEEDCRKLESKAHTLAGSIIEKYQRQEWIYDIRTGHGTTQGATFP